jgi:ABC-2 type transport system permease protein
VSAGLLHYRPWRGTFRSPLLGFWPVARIALAMIFRRKLFWGLYALGLTLFLLYFFGQYLLAWAAAQGGSSVEVVPGRREDPRWLVKMLSGFLKMNGTGETYRNFIWYQGWIVMAVLALAGSVLVGNDIHHGSLPFYLSKPLSRWHYLLGKFLAVGLFVNLLTTLPALVLWLQYGLLHSWYYFTEQAHLAVGILGYGALLTVCLSVMILATAAWLRRTAPLVMVWTTVFVFGRQLSRALVDQLKFDPRWRLIDVWNNMYVLGHQMMGLKPADITPAVQPTATEAALVLGGVCLLCLSYLVWRIRAVEVVT